MNLGSVRIHKPHAQFTADLILRHGMTWQTRKARKLGGGVVQAARLAVHPHILNEGLEQWKQPD